MNKNQKLFLKEIDYKLKKLQAEFDKLGLEIHFDIKPKSEEEPDPYHWTYSNY